MREIKFRGKKVGSGEWVYGYLIDIKALNDADQDRALRIVTQLVDGLIYTPIITETVGQFTGLRDSTGKEIWEGDILQSPYMGYRRYPVTFKESSGSFAAETKAIYVETESWYKYKVIGNIYENPELLTGGK